VIAYVDSSALLKLYLDEPETPIAFAALHEYETWATARHTLVEVRRNLARLLTGDALASARGAFAEDWEKILVVELDRGTCNAAASLAEQTGVKSLDALHLGAAKAAGAADGLPLITFDRGVRGAAKSLGWLVLPS
jgi:predicted nucleic acid-binding protein